MTDQSTTESRSEHLEKITAAIQAAKDDGYEVESTRWAVVVTSWNEDGEMGSDMRILQ